MHGKWLLGRKNKRKFLQRNPCFGETLEQLQETMSIVERDKMWCSSVVANCDQATKFLNAPRICDA